jgi:hypothetical protein
MEADMTATEKDIGKWCKFWDYDDSNFEIDKLLSIDDTPHTSFPFITRQHIYAHCEPLTSADFAEMGAYDGIRKIIAGDFAGFIDGKPTDYDELKLKLIRIKLIIGADK